MDVTANELKKISDEAIRKLEEQNAGKRETFLLKLQAEMRKAAENGKTSLICTIPRVKNSF